MKISKKVFSTLLFLVLVAALSLPAQEIDYKGLKQLSLHKKDSTEYVLYTPDSLEKNKRYPIALFLHGCCGTNDHASLRNAVDPPMRMWHQFGANKQKIPTYIISPATSRGWKKHMPAIKAVIDELIHQQQGDSQRVYICGFSMGGEGTAQFLTAYPNFFAAAITMGMTIKTNPDSVKHIPLWVNRGSEDYYGRGLGKQVAEIRHLNGAPPNDSSTTNRGVNPRFTNFEGRGHGIQWEAASTQDLTDWAYSKINDGNLYPNVWFTAPTYGQKFVKGQQLEVSAEAADPDGEVIKAEYYVNGRLVKTLNAKPFNLSIPLKSGDTYVNITVYDNRGKTATATNRVYVEELPVIVTGKLPSAVQGNFYDANLQATGNGPFIFSSPDRDHLPKGLSILPDGRLRGLTATTGKFSFDIAVTDEFKKQVIKKFILEVRARDTSEILISSAQNSKGNDLIISRLREDEAPNFNSKDSLTSELPETHFSERGPYHDLIFIRTDVNDANSADSNALSFIVDKPAQVLIAYEVLDKSLSSGIPGWLKSYKKEPGQIVAQYRYFNIYSRVFPAGKVILPGADAATNKVGSNYFVMVRKP